MTVVTTPALGGVGPAVAPSRRKAPALERATGQPAASSPAADVPADAKPIRPRGKARDLRFCDECGHPFFPAAKHQTFCGEGCRHRSHNRDRLRGAELLREGLTWVRDTAAKGGITRVSRLLYRYRAEDRDRAEAHAAIRAAYEQQQREGT